MTENIEELKARIRDLEARLKAAQVSQTSRGSGPQEDLEKILREVEEKAKEIAREPTEKTVKISRVSVATAREVYGEKVKRPGDRILLLWAGEEVVGKIPLPEKLSRRTALYRFIQKYGQAPRPGLEIQIRENERGYWQVVLKD